MSIRVSGGNHSTVHAGEENGLGLKDKAYQELVQILAGA